MKVYRPVSSRTILRCPHCGVPVRPERTLELTGGGQEPETLRLYRCPFCRKILKTTEIIVRW